MSHVAMFFLVGFALAAGLLLALLGLETLRRNILGWLLLAVGIGYSAGVILYFWIRKEPLQRPGMDDAVAVETRKKSFWLIVPGMLATLLAPPFEYIYFPEILPRAIWMQVIGLAPITVAVTLFLWTRASIRGPYSRSIRVTAKHQLIQSGPYRIIRHPVDAGIILIALGLTLGYSSLAGLAAVLFILLPTVVYRILVDDQSLAEHFGVQFDEYSRRTRRLIPGLW
jgi:protein-S-isoprenylcysteine O-methyltransferase Ste14